MYLIGIQNFSIGFTESMSWESKKHAEHMRPIFLALGWLKMMISTLS